MEYGHHITMSGLNFIIRDIYILPAVQNQGSLSVGFSLRGGGLDITQLSLTPAPIENNYSGDSESQHN